MFIFLYRLVLFVSILGWDDYTLMISFVVSFMSKGFPYKDQIEELFIVMVYCMYYSQYVTLSTLSD